MKHYISNLLFPKTQADIDIFRLKHKRGGSLNFDKTIYYINEENGDLGFFAMYRYWLEYLYFADVCGYIPVIDVGKDFAYYDNSLIMNTKNVFEYYFIQPTSINVTEAKHSSKVIFSDIIHRQMVELIFTGKRSHYDCSLRYLQFMGYIARKYLKYNVATQNYIDRGIAELGFKEQKVVGVHIRGTDFRKKYNNHPLFVTEEECFNAIEHLFDNKEYSKIFLATDDQNILDVFINKYGDKIIYYSDVMRSKVKTSVAFIKSNRDRHKYKLGLEVIRDMYTLSQCDGLIAGVSQVAICARINKLARKEKYKDIIIIDKGIYKNEHHFHK